MNSYRRASGPTAAFSITGFVAGGDGDVIVLENPLAHVMTIKNEHLSSVASNRIVTGTGADVTAKSAILIYDASSARWKLISSGIGASGSIGGSGSVLLVWGEQPFGTKDGANTGFRLYWVPSAIPIELYLNGAFLVPNVDSVGTAIANHDYTIDAAGNIVITNAAMIPISSDILLAYYARTETPTVFGGTGTFSFSLGWLGYGYYTGGGAIALSPLSFAGAGLTGPSGSGNIAIGPLSFAAFNTFGPATFSLSPLSWQGSEIVTDPRFVDDAGNIFELDGSFRSGGGPDTADTDNAYGYSFDFDTSECKAGAWPTYDDGVIGDLDDGSGYQGNNDHTQRTTLKYNPVSGVLCGVERKNSVGGVDEDYTVVIRNATTVATIATDNATYVTDWLTANASRYDYPTSPETDWQLHVSADPDDGSFWINFPQSYGSGPAPATVPMWHIDAADGSLIETVDVDFVSQFRKRLEKRTD